MALKITGKDIKFTHNSVEVANPALANALVQDNQAAIQLLQAKAPSLKPKDIVIGPNGILEIKNKELIKQLKKEDILAAKNSFCGLGC
jgi:hypothetical protein